MIFFFFFLLRSQMPLDFFPGITARRTPVEAALNQISLASSNPALFPSNTAGLNGFPGQRPALAHALHFFCLAIAARSVPAMTCPVSQVDRGRSRFRFK